MVLLGQLQKLPNPSISLSIDTTQINHLQAFQNAHDITPIHHYILPVFISVQWLKISERIEYEILPPTYTHSNTPRPHLH